MSFKIKEKIEVEGYREQDYQISCVRIRKNGEKWAVTASGTSSGTKTA
jgi:hypothetical protein